MCYFCNCNPEVKLKLLHSYYSDFYGGVLWDLAYPSVEDVCIIWRKGLKRVWDLPTRTHSTLVAPLCGLLPLRFELVCRCAGFIVKCLNSSNSVVRSIARHGVYFQRMLSPIGRNAQYSAALLRTPLSKLASVNKKLAWTIVNNVVLSDSDVLNMNMILELLYFKQNIGDLTFLAKRILFFMIEYCFISYFFSNVISSVCV